MLYTEQDVGQEIKDFVLREFMTSDPGAVLTDDRQLVEGGIIDSLGIFLVIGFIEEKFQTKVDAEDIVLENFETVEAIKQMVIRRMAAD